ARGAALGGRHELHDDHGRDAGDSRGPVGGERAAAPVLRAMKRGAALLLLGALTAAAALAQQPKEEPPRDAKRDAAVSSLTIFAGTKEGLWRSLNWGIDWTLVKADALARLGAAYCILPVGPRVYLGGEGGLYLPEDFGETWTQPSAGGPVLSLQPSRYPYADLTLFVGAPTGLLKSEDAGRTFRPRPLEQPVTRIEWPGPALVVA